MIPSRRPLAWALAGIAALIAAAASAAPMVGGARLEPLSFSKLSQWAEDDHAAALAGFKLSCEYRSGASPGPMEAGLAAACERALPVPPGEARSFFETHFSPHLVVPSAGRGFLTGYYEPEFEGSRQPTPRFRTPLLSRPDDLVDIPRGEAWPGFEGLQAARRTATGHEPYPDRAAIESGALGERAQPIVHLAEPGEAFIIHVQGSSRIRLAEGGSMRVAYAGRNGQPYTSIGRVLVERGEVSLAEMSLERLMGWLKEHPGPAQELMRLNRSYIFFREATELSPESGPIGGAGHPLVPGRSLAVDRSLWSYGLPFWLEGEVPVAPGGTEPLARLMVAQDTGSAIIGPARGDFFWGTGREAGTRAGLLRHPARFVVLLPKS